VAERTGKDRATVANAVRLLKLEPTIQEWIEEGKLSAGHGRALLAVADAQTPNALCASRFARRFDCPADRTSRCAPRTQRLARQAGVRTTLTFAPLSMSLQRHLGTKVLLREKTKVRPGQLVLEYYEDAQLMGLYDRLMK